MTPRYLFDTHACLHLIRRGPGELLSLFDRCAPGEIAISSLTLAALRARAQHSRDPQRNRQALNQFVLPLVVVDFDAEAAQWLGVLAVQAEAQGGSAAQETMLAAQALRLHAELVTPRPDLYAGLADLRLVVVGASLPLTQPLLAEPRSAPAAQPPPAEPRSPSLILALPQPNAPSLAPDGMNASLAPPRTLRIAGSHDFTLDLLANALHTADPNLSVMLESVGSLRGLLALQQGAAHIAPAHLLDEETGDFNRGYIQHLLTPLGVRVVLLGFVERQQGLIVRKGNPKAIAGLADLLRPDVTFVNRQRGAGTRVLLDYHLRRAALPTAQISGYERQEPTHLAVAAAVADGRADCGLGVPAAARSLALDFLPLFHERFDLVIPVEHYAGPLLAPLLALLRRPQSDFVRRVAALGGYGTTGIGKVLAEL